MVIKMSKEIYTPLLLEWINTWIQDDLSVHKYTKIYYSLLEDSFKLTFEDLLIPIGYNEETKEIINASIPVLIIKHVEISKYIESYNSLISYLNEELINSKTYLKIICKFVYPKDFNVRISILSSSIILVIDVKLISIATK